MLSESDPDAALLNSRRPCLVRNCAREQGPIRRGLSVDVRCARHSFTTRAGGYGSLRSQGRRERNYDAPSRNLNRCIFPVAVIGNESTTSIQRGYFHGPIFCLTCS